MTFTVDTHHHMLPGFFWEATEGDDPVGGIAPPLWSRASALAELAYALDDLQLDGVLLFSNARGVYLGDSQFTPLFDELQRRAAVVFVHPNPSPDPSAHSLGLLDTLIDFTADTTRAIAQLHYSNTFARTPDVKYIFAGTGGTVPYLAGRFGIIDEMRVIPGAEGRATAAETFRRLYWDTAASWGDPCCACCATSWESTPSYSAPTTPTCAAIWPSPAASTSRPPRNSPTASGRPSSAPRARR